MEALILTTSAQVLFQVLALAPVRVVETVREQGSGLVQEGARSRAHVWVQVLARAWEEGLVWDSAAG